MKKITKDKKALKELYDMLENWQRGDLVKGGYWYKDVEKYDQGFLRGWRWGIKSVLMKLDELL